MPEGTHRAKHPAGGRHSAWVATAGAALLVAGAFGLNGGDHPGNDVGHPATSSSAEETTGMPRPRLARPEPGYPRLVRIPEIGVSSSVVPIHAPDRTLVPPSDPRRLGWWADGAKPGEAEGSAVVTGHTVHSGGGALDHLEDLRPGDEVVVRTDDVRLRYAVARVRIYSKGSLAQHAENVFSQDGSGRLVIVTCEDWNGERYLSNVVVTATRRA